MTKWQKRLLFAVVFVLLVTNVTGCVKKEGSSVQSDSELSTLKVSSDFNPTGLPIMKHPITLRIITAHRTFAKKNFEEKEFYKKISAETNVNIEWEEVAGVINERLTLAISSGDLPDAVYANGVPNFAGAIKDGLILPLDDYINKYAPNQKKLLELYPIVKVLATYTGDGKIYSYSGLGLKTEAELRAPLLINKVWLDNLGLKVPTTLEEFYNVLSAFKTKDPNQNGKQDEIPLTFDPKTNTYEDLLAIWGVIDVKTRFHTRINNGKLIFQPTETRYKDALSFLNKLYSEGLLDSEFMTQTRNQVKSKGEIKPAIFGVFTAFDIDGTIGSKNASEYQAILPLKGPYGDQVWPYNPSSLERYNGLIIFKDCKYPEAAIRWVDHLNDGVNAITNAYGPENVSWKRDEATKTWWTLEPELAKQGLSLEDMRQTEATQNGPDMVKIDQITGYKYKAAPGSRDAQKIEWSNMYRPYFNKEFWSDGSPISEKTDDSAEIGQLAADFNSYFSAFVADVITNGQADQKWDAHLKKCRDFQVDKVVQYYQDIYDEQLKLMNRK